ncbi:MAG: hypothetical protein ACK42D_01595 [Candidatus Paceibacteria bacterium]
MEHYNRTNPIAIVVSLLVGAIVGYLIGTFTADTQMGTAVQDVGDRAQQNIEEIEFQNNRGDDVTGNNATLTEEEANETAFVIQVSRLSDAQQAALRTAGVDDDEIVITRGMVVCAEAEMGASRVAEIEDGASISMGEGVTLVSCYNNN